jgi:glycosyltransferase involved in cell wall biosynthesis
MQTTTSSNTTGKAASPWMPLLSEVRNDWSLLDHPNFEVPENIHLISHERFTHCLGLVVRYIPPGRLSISLRFSAILFNCAYALKLLRSCDQNTVLIVNGSADIWLFVGLLNRLVYHSRRKVLCWDIFVEVKGSWKRKLMSAALKGMTLSVLWSRKQIRPHSEFLGISEERFIFLPYKSNHSKGPRYDLPIGNFVFAGGNGKRDYKCLIEAVRDTNIPVIISATDPAVRKSIDPLPNVIVLGAPEPAFAQLQAASRFVVVPMVCTGLKGGGEANFCNAMWHGKPVIAADSIAAADYVIEGETGFVVPSGDSMALRRRILELWGNADRTRKMGMAAKLHVEQQFTHHAFIRRLLRLAMLVGDA